jgi:transposase
LAVAAPQWLMQIVESDWFTRYGRRIEEDRLPKGKAARVEFAETIGRDGMQLLDAIYAPDCEDWLAEIPAVETLRRVWVHQYYIIEGQLRFRNAKHLPPASIRFDSPYDPDAHYGNKRSTTWTGYKVHVTETCDSKTPRMITNVETSIAPKSDVDMTEPIHQALLDKGHLPSVHFADAGYVDAQLLVSSQTDYQIELVGPVRPDVSWQAKAKDGYSIENFAIDWTAKTVTCPQGHTTKSWKSTTDAWDNDLIHIQFSRPVCRKCPARKNCTQSKDDPRSLTLRQQAQHQALQEGRQQQKTKAWKHRYGLRAGVEGTFSQGVRAFGLRHCRYIGLAKTHLQHVLTAAAINIVRFDAWLTGSPLAETRTSHFLALLPYAA